MPEIDVTEGTLKRIKDYSNQYRDRLKNAGMPDAAIYFDGDSGVFDAAIEFAIADSEEVLKEPGSWEARLSALKDERKRMQRAKDKDLR